MLGRPDRLPTWYMVWPGENDNVYGMAYQAWHCIWYDLEGIAWYMVWPGRHGLVLPGRHGIVYGLVGRTWHGRACVVYCITWVDMVWYVCGLAGMAWYILLPDGHMVWPGRYGMIYGLAWLAWQGICYDLAGNSMVYGMIWRQWHGIWYGLAGKACYMVWPEGHGMIFIMAWWAWHGMALLTWHGIRWGLTGMARNIWYMI